MPEAGPGSAGATLLRQQQLWAGCAAALRLELVRLASCLPDSSSKRADEEEIPTYLAREAANSSSIGQWQPPTLREVRDMHVRAHSRVRAAGQYLGSVVANCKPQMEPLRARAAAESVCQSVCP